MPETRPGAIAPATDEPSSARSVDDVVSEVGPTPVVLPKLYGTITPPDPLPGPAGDEWIQETREETQRLMKSVAHLPDADELQEDIVKLHARDFTGRLDD